MCAFPFHLWTLIFAFRDMSWLIDRTNLWDAIGNLSYALVFAFFESLIIFAVLTLLGFFTPARWEVNRRVAFLTMLLFSAVIWGMLTQLSYLWNIWLPVPLMKLIAQTGRPLFALYLISLAIVFPSIALPAFVFLRSKKALPNLLDIMERLSLLSTLYLVLDVLGLIIVVVRNIS
jgi:hypothetical protein